MKSEYWEMIIGEDEREKAIYTASTRENLEKTLRELKLKLNTYMLGKKFKFKKAEIEYTKNSIYYGSPNKIVLFDFAKKMVEQGKVIIIRIIDDLQD